jgi:hypothetical protein
MLTKSLEIALIFELFNYCLVTNMPPRLGGALDQPNREYEFFAIFAGEYSSAKAAKQKGG